MSEFELFIKAIQSGSNELIIKHFNVKYMNKRWGPLKRCPMHLACDMGNIYIVKLLIDEKCNIESCDKDNWQPIHLACARGHVEIVRLLMQEKCDIAAVNRNGDSPMKLARKYQYQAIIDLLNERQSELERVWSLKTQESERLIEMMGVKCTLLCTHKQLCPNSIRSKTFPKGTKVGHGSFGDVCKMKGTGTNKEFALKYINIEDIERRYIEGRIDEFIPVLDHPRIIKYFGAIETEKKLCIFMEYFPNNSIQHKIKEEGCIGITDVVRYTKQIIEGLEFLHGKKIIHRDLKPDNILLNNEDNIKLTDFGLSRSLIKTGGITIPARTFVGTANFTAPEIINSEPYREPADIWSVAASMINMITGKPPYHGFQSVTVLFKISSTKTIEMPDSISDEMKGFILSMLNPDPSERPSATNLLKSDLFK